MRAASLIEVYGPDRSFRGEQLTGTAYGLLGISRSDRTSRAREVDAR